MIDLAEGMAPGYQHKMVGIRPGEKLHEVMCPADDSHLTLEFKDHYVICPTINFGQDVNYQLNAIEETGRPVELGFEYNSANNPNFLAPNQIIDLVDMNAKEAMEV